MGNITLLKFGSCQVKILSDDYYRFIQTRCVYISVDRQNEPIWSTQEELYSSKMASLSLASGAVACLFIGTAVYTVGLGLPYWNSYSSNEYRGLWETCYYDYYCYSKVCFYNTYDRMHDGRHSYII